MKCALCGKTIKNSFYLNGKAYGYNCYKMELAKYKLEQQQLLNDEYALTVSNTIQVYKSKSFTRSYSADFQKSILDQYTSCGKLTFKQLKAVHNTFNQNDWYRYNLLKFNILYDYEMKDGEIVIRKHTGEAKKNREKLNIAKNIIKEFYSKQNIHEDITEMLNDESFKDVLTYVYIDGYVINIDVDEPEFLMIDDIKELEDLQDDEYIKIIEIVRI